MRSWIVSLFCALNRVYKKDATWNIHMPHTIRPSQYPPPHCISRVYPQRIHFLAITL